LSDRLSDDLLLVARHLVEGAPSEASYRRAASTAYYAVFHKLSEILLETFDTLADDPTAPHLLESVYRAFDHGKLKMQFDTIPMTFDEEIRDAAVAFVSLQGLRHEADYKPPGAMTLATAKQSLSSAEKAVEIFGNMTSSQRRDLFTFLLFRSRKR
jgi:hypothetical protein